MCVNVQKFGVLVFVLSASLAAQRDFGCPGESPNFPIDNRAGTELDLFVQSVQLSQAIQDGTIVMVGDRPTFVRVTVGWTGSHSQVTGVDARLTVTVDGIPIAGSPFSSRNGPITAPSSADLNNENDTINFRFDVADSNYVDLSVELNPPGHDRVWEINYENNTHALENQVFECRKSMTIRYLAIDYQFEPPPGGQREYPAETWIKPGVGEDFVRAIYPSPNIRYSKYGKLTWDKDICATGQASTYLNELVDIRDRMDPKPDFLYAWLPASAFTCDPLWFGYGRTNGEIAFGTDDATRHQRTFAHELGHNFGLNHPPGYPSHDDPSGDEYIGVAGVDVENLLELGRIKPSTLYGIMVPGLDTDEAWVDPTSYQFFLDDSVLACGTKRTEEPVLLITGLFDPLAVTATIDPVREFPLGEPSTPNPAGNLILRAYHIDGGEELIYEVRFAALGIECPTEDPCIGPIVVRIPVMPGSPPQQVDRIDILLASTLEVLAQRWRSESPPEIAIVTPAPGGVLSDGMEITWTGTDADLDTIYYALAYSWDDGACWTPLVANTTETSTILDAEFLPGSDADQARLQLTATDGLNTVSDEVDNLTLDAKKPPVVGILTPAEGATEFDGAPVALTASVHDPEDGELPLSSIVWQSNIDGFLGTGTSLLVASLSLGVHELTVTATDSDLMVGTDAVTIEVQTRPAASIPGDFNHDGVVGFDDFENLLRCFAGPDCALVGSCLEFDPDLDGDLDVDLADFALFQAAFTGSGR